MPNTSENKQPLRHKILLVVDIIMIALVVIDLFLIAFDGVFEVKLIREQLFMKIAPGFTNWYETHINHNFLLYESSVFISIFMTELLVRWALAIYHRTYDKWFFYPIHHWYDVLGCIPTSSFRILRFFRIVVLLYRLHRWKVINLNDYAVYRLILHYYNIMVEEVSDRVAVNLLEETKSEMNRGEPIGNAIVSQVLQPYQPQIVAWASSNIQNGLRRHYHEHRNNIQVYLKQIIRETVDKNKEVSGLERIPFMGSYITESINKAVCDISFGVIDRISSELASTEKAIIIETVVSAVTDILFTANKMATKEQKKFSNQLISNAIDLIIERVKEKKWKMVEIKEEDEGDVFY